MMPRDEVIELSEVESDDGDADVASSPGVEVVVITDEQGRGVNLSCVADVSPADLIESALNLIQQVTRAALRNPSAKSAGDLGLGDDEAF
ncbi:MAG: hypothetical protein H0W99_02465 [Acidobacteria bacterium]|nr:hypothetical protein [Acidobacteriota bacterium]